MSFLISKRHLIYEHVYLYCKELLIDNQQEFLKMKFAITNFLVLEQTIWSGQIIYTDFSKVFSRCWGNWNSLNFLPIQLLCLENLYLVLHNKLGLVKIYIIWLTFHRRSAGFTLYPLWFNVLVNDISKRFEHCDFLMSAGDSKLFRQSILTCTLTSINIHI